MPPDWGRIASHAAPALERGTVGSVRLLAVVPDAEAALALASALAALPQTQSRRIVAATSAARATRLLGEAVPDAVVGSAEVLAAALGTTKLKLQDVATVLIAGADELDADSEALTAVLAEVPLEAARILTALTETTGVGSLLERYLPKARRVLEDVAPAKGSAVASTVRYLTLATEPVDALPALLDELDPPSAVVLTANVRQARAAEERLRAIGYNGSALVNVTTDSVPANASLVITLGVPSATAWQEAVAAQPAQIVALIAPRELPALRLLAGATTPRPLTDRAAVSRARATEARRRAELRVELSEGIASREVLALEPLLREHDGLEIAAAALRLLERSRAGTAEAVRNAEEKAKAAAKEAAREERSERGDRRDRPFKPREDRGDRPPYKPREDRAERPFKPREDRGDRPFKPRADRGDRPFKPREDRGDRPFKPRADRGDRPFKPREDRGDRPFKPREDRGDRPFKPRGGPKGFKPGGGRNAPRGPQ